MCFVFIFPESGTCKQYNVLYFYNTYGVNFITEASDDVRKRFVHIGRKKVKRNFKLT